jgi:Calcineurin-like phosphoesterase
MGRTADRYLLGLGKADVSMKLEKALLFGIALGASSCANVVETEAPPPEPAVDGVNSEGGTVARLSFAVVGDTRPAVLNDARGYPIDVINRIYDGVEALDPHPAFAVATGDYVFASPGSTQANAQFDLYLAARDRFTGVVFPAMGNHECTGLTESNCIVPHRHGISNNYTAFMSMLLGPIHKVDPYYMVEVNATDGSWTSKLVVIAANAWSNEQAEWLERSLSIDTTYTFIVRHEPRDAVTAPGVRPSERIMGRHPYTLAICGHTHTYMHSQDREVIIGNGGAPLTGNRNYGFGLVQRREDGAIQVDMFDYFTRLPDKSFEFAVNPDGTPAP